MNLASVLSLLGLLAMGLGLFMLAPLGVAVGYGESAWHAFLGGAVICFVLGGSLFWLFREQTPKELSHRQGMAIVGLGWALAGILGAVPLFLSGDFASLTDAIFESVSGFTTTGASILTNVEGAGKGVLFWRALTHWLGGMGFIVLGVAILPFVGVGGMQLFKAEVPSPTPDKLGPRITDTAGVLWKVYAVLTAAETGLLMLGGMDWFDAVCHSFATLATGGFSTKNASVAAYDSPYIEWVITVFMVAAGVNFNLHFLFLWQRKKGAFFKDEEWRVYMGLFLAASLVMALALFAVKGLGVEQSFRLAAFQAATILTTTGFATADYSMWPPACLGVLIALMFIGGSAGSTGGGPKVMRVQIILKGAFKEFGRLVHPRLVAPVKLGRRTVDKNVVSAVWAFMGLYLLCFLLTGMALTVMGIDFITAFSASIACLGNIGPGLGMVGPAGNYAELPMLAKWLLTVEMIVGRLELYAILVLLVPEFWRK